MDKINPALYLTDTDPVDETVPTISNWYVTEDSGLVQLSEDALAWMLAQGWRVYLTSTNAYGVVSYGLRRKRIDPQQVLTNLISSYVTAYNEGRDINDQRYDDLVALYSAMLDKAEDEFVSLDADDATWEALVEALITNIESDHTTHAAAVDDYLGDYGTSLTTQINNRFDAQLTSLQQDLVSRGMYNSTVWASVSVGIERERTLALDDLQDKITQQELANKHRVYEQKVAMRSRILAARDRLRTALSEAVSSRLAGRNAVLQALCNFAERRSDSYPDLGQVGQIASSLGLGAPQSFTP